MQATIPVTEPLIVEKSAAEGPVAKSGAALTLQALRVRRTASLLTLAIAITGGLSVWYILSSRFEATDNAFVEASVHPVSSRVAGDVVEVLVVDNQAVTRGQVLARLDPRDCVLKVHAAEADLACASADILQARATVDMARARLKESAAQTDTSAAQQEKTRLDRERAERLFQGANRAISKQEFDSAQAAFDVASGSHGVAMAGQEAATASLEAARGALAASESWLPRVGASPKRTSKPASVSSQASHCWRSFPNAAGLLPTSRKTKWTGSARGIRSKSEWMRYAENACEARSRASPREPEPSFPYSPRTMLPVTFSRSSREFP
jgi:hypothetical protein